jgi:hypothetical protein
MYFVVPRTPRLGANRQMHLAEVSPVVVAIEVFVQENPDNRERKISAINDVDRVLVVRYSSLEGDVAWVLLNVWWNTWRKNDLASFVKVRRFFGEMIKPQIRLRHNVTLFGDENPPGSAVMYSGCPAVVDRINISHNPLSDLHGQGLYFRRPNIWALIENKVLLRLSDAFVSEIVSSSGLAGVGK